MITFISPTLRKNNMTDNEIRESFEELYPPKTFYAGGLTIDRVARAEAFSAYVDSLERDGIISMEQAHNIYNPY